MRGLPRHASPPAPVVTRLLVCLLCVAARGVAEAQEPPRDPVAEAPFRLGVAGVAPTFSVTNMGVDGNVFNSRDDPRKDFTLTATPRARLWLRTHRGLLSLDGQVDLVYFATYASERSANVAGTITYEYPLTRVRPFLSYEMVRTRERPGYEIDVRAGRFEGELRTGASVAVGSASGLEVTRRQERVTFDGDAVFGGRALNQTLGGTRGAWDVRWRQPLTVLTTWIVDVARERERFAFEPYRNSNSVRISSGFELGLFALVRGQAFVGYRRLVGADGGTLARFSGLTADMDVSYTAPTNSRIQVVVSRDVRYSFELEQPYYVQTGFTLAGTQRVFGRWDLQVTGGRDGLAYRSVHPGSGRHDRMGRLGGGIAYEAGENLRIGFDVLVQRRYSELAPRDYRALKSGVSVTYGY